MVGADGSSPRLQGDFMQKIHYSLYQNNVGEKATPYCNDNARYPVENITRDWDKVTCKRCLKNKQSHLIELIRSPNFSESNYYLLMRINRVLES